VARDDGPTPSFAETLLVFGVISALAEIVGTGPVILTTPEGERWRDGGRWGTPTVTPTTGPVFLSSGRARASVVLQPGNDDLTEALRRRLAADPLQRWTVAALAEEAGTSARTFQRALARKHLSFSRLVADARLEVAASLLCDAGVPGLAATGFLSGYSDQAHFARSFRRAVGTTPYAYRADFAR
jgi:AraC-like DNA-binding protein